MYTIKQTFQMSLHPTMHPLAYTPSKEVITNSKAIECLLKYIKDWDRGNFSTLCDHAYQCHVHCYSSHGHFCNAWAFLKAR